MEAGIPEADLQFKARPIPTPNEVVGSVAHSLGVPGKNDGTLKERKMDVLQHLGLTTTFPGETRFLYHKEPDQPADIEGAHTFIADSLARGEYIIGRLTLEKMEKYGMRLFVFSLRSKHDFWVADDKTDMLFKEDGNHPKYARFSEASQVELFSRPYSARLMVSGLRSGVERVCSVGGSFEITLGDVITRTQGDGEESFVTNDGNAYIDIQLYLALDDASKRWLHGGEGKIPQIAWTFQAQITSRGLLIPELDFAGVGDRINGHDLAQILAYRVLTQNWRTSQLLAAGLLENPRPWHAQASGNFETQYVTRPVLTGEQVTQLEMEVNLTDFESAELSMVMSENDKSESKGLTNTQQLGQYYLDVDQYNRYRMSRVFGLIPNRRPSSYHILHEGD